MAPTINLLVRGVNHPPRVALVAPRRRPERVVRALCHKSSTDRNAWSKRTVEGRHACASSAHQSEIGRSDGDRYLIGWPGHRRLAGHGAPREGRASLQATQRHAGAALGQCFLDIRQAHAAGCWRNPPPGRGRCASAISRNRSSGRGRKLSALGSEPERGASTVPCAQILRADSRGSGGDPKTGPVGYLETDTDCATPISRPPPPTASSTSTPACPSTLRRHSSAWRGTAPGRPH